MSTVFRPADPTPARSSRGRTAGLIGAGALVVLGGLYGAGYALTGNNVPPNTTVGGVPIGGLSAADAQAALKQGFAKASGDVALKSGDATVVKSAPDLGLGIDYAASVSAAGARKSWNPADMLAALTGGRSLQPVVSIDSAKLDAALASVAASDTKPTDAAITLTGATPSVTPSVNGRALDAAKAAEAIRAGWPATASFDLPTTVTPAEVTTAEAQQALDAFAKPALSGPVTVKAGDKSFDLAPDALAGALTFKASDGTLKGSLDAAKLAAVANGSLSKLGVKAPVDATVKIGSDGKPQVVPSSDGLGVAPDALAAAVLPVLTQPSGRVASVTLTTVKAPFDTAAAQALGVKEVTGEFTTVFPGTYPYRYVNIPKAAGMLTNIVVKPGETFSMNAALGGERTIAKGWAAGFGIMDGKETIQVGGALSQVTTTTYNAVFFAGLEDIYHKPHSLYFSRYPKGREATLNYPDVDMKFRNDSPYGVLLQVTWTGHVGVQGTITARVWSTKQYEVKQANTRITNEKIVSNLPPVKDDSPTCVAQEAADGFDIAFDRQFWKDGQLVKSIPMTWHYNTLTPTTCTNPVAIKAASDRTKG